MLVKALLLQALIFHCNKAQHTDEYLVVVKNLTTEEQTTSRTVNTSIRLLRFPINGKRLNEIEYETTGVNQKELPLQKGLNVIEVRTDLSCQNEMMIYLDTPSTLYPNPVQDKLTVLVGGDSAIVDLTIYDIQGNQRYFEEVQLNELHRSIEIAVADYLPGNYIVKLVTVENVETLKFIKQMKTNLILLLVVASLTLLGCKDPIRIQNKLF